MGTAGQLMEVEEDEKDERQWSALPHLPLRDIADRLETPADFSCFRLASASWRWVSEWAMKDFLASQPPWLFSADNARLFCIRERRFYRRTNELPDGNQNWVVGFSSGHLILAADHTLLLVDPFTGREVHRFPDAPHDFSKVVLTSPVGSGDCVLIAFDSTSMQYYRAGSDSGVGMGWSVLRFPTDDGIGHIRNVGMFGGRAFALTADGKLCHIDFSTPSPELKLLESSERLPLGRFQGTWLGACGDNLVAISCTYQPTRPGVERFVVRRFDFSSRGWVKMESLEDRTLFVDLSWGVLSPDDHRRPRPGGSGNRIYFVDPLRNSPRIFHLEDGSMEDITPSAAVAGGHGFFRWDLCVWVLPSLCR